MRKTFLFDSSIHILKQIKSSAPNDNMYSLKYDLKINTYQPIEQISESEYEVYPQYMEIFITPKSISESLPEDFSFQELIKFLKELGVI